MQSNIFQVAKNIKTITEQRNKPFQDPSVAQNRKRIKDSHELHHKRLESLVTKIHDHVRSLKKNTNPTEQDVLYLTRLHSQLKGAFEDKE